MAKTGIDHRSVEPYLRTHASGRGWALCIGAGTSFPVFPSWTALVERFVARDFTNAVPDPADRAAAAGALLARLREGLSLDALLSAARDRLAIPVDEFGEHLADELYGELERRAGADWETFVRAFFADPGGLAQPRWQRFHSFFATNYPNASAPALARIVADAIEDDIAPTAILSFNAEPLLYGLINAELACRCKALSGGQMPMMKRALDGIVRSISSQTSGRVPYYFCHGLLPAKASRKLPGTTLARAARDKLVFSESEYLAIANSAFSWQSSVFTSAATERSLVFVGLSFSDANLRKWLAWVHATRRAELKDIYGQDGDSTAHYWINKRPPTACEERWIESSVAHLGVRLVWLDDWTDLEPHLRRALGL